MGEPVHRTDATEASGAYRRIYEAYYPQVLAYCARRVGRDDARDLAAEVFAVAWRRRNAVPLDDKSLPWLYGVAYRVVSHHWRSRGRRLRLQTRLAALPAARPEGPEAQLVQRQEYDLVLLAASRLRPLDQEVLRLAVWEELSHQQIADLLDSSLPAVRQRFHRAKRALLKEFERVGGTLPPSAVAQEGGER
jgi:RNA polymerase sigma-70 factor (ECF subfamily)